MQAKEYMRNVRKAEEDLILIAQKRRHLMELGTNISNNWQHEPGGGNNPSSRVETAVVDMADLMTELELKETKYKAIIREAETLISQLEQPKHREVLTYYYLCHMSWPEVSQKMGYKEPHSVFKVHGYALQKLQRLL